MADLKYMEKQVYDVSLGADVYKVYVSLGAGGTTASSGIYNVLDYGAAKDGVTDDAASIQAAIDACEAAGRGTVLIPAGEYYVGSTLTVDRGSGYAADRASSIKIEAAGAIIEAPITLDAPILRIGAAANRNRNIHLSGASLRYASYNWDSGASCLELFNAYNCQISNIRVQHGYSGIRLRADGTGCVYNNINDVYSTDCLNAFHLTRDDTDGWVNENIFTGGGCAYTTSCPDASSGYGLSLTVAADSGNTMNNNKFIGLSLECGMSSNKPTAVYDQRGFYNLFIGLRYEGFDTPYFSFGTSTDSNTIIGGYVNSSSDIIAAASQTKSTIITGDEVFFSGGDATNAPLTIVNNSSSAYPAIIVRNATNDTDEVVAYSDGRLYSRALILDPRNAPSAPAEGTIYYDTTSNAVLVYNGSAWVSIGLWDGHTELSDTAYTDIVIAPSSFKVPASSNPTEITWLTNLKAFSFATGEYIHMDGIQLPHGYAPGTDLLFHVHFVPAADITDGEVVRFTLTYTISSPFYGFPATATVTTDFTNNAAWRASLSAGQAAAILSGTTVASANTPHLLTTSGTIDGTDLNLSSVLAGKLEYTASGTTYTGEAIVTSIDFHYQVNRLGSENEFTG